jgi:hypothetical protein
VRHPRYCIAAAGALALLASACSVDPPSPPGPEPATASRAMREAEMNSAWQNHSVAELLHARGPARVLFDIPGGGSPAGYVLVYPRDAATGCLDAYAVMAGSEDRVRIYYCR